MALLNGMVIVSYKARQTVSANEKVYVPNGEKYIYRQREIYI